MNRGAMLLHLVILIMQIVLMQLHLVEKILLLELPQQYLVIGILQ